jgi:hypothetical protein
MTTHTHIFRAYSVNSGPEIEVAASSYEEALSVAAEQLYAKVRYVKTIATVELGASAHGAKGVG